MAMVIAGMTMSLDGFGADPSGSASRLYTDLAALRDTSYMKAAIEETGAVLMGRRAFEMGDPDSYVGNYEFQVPIFVLTHHPPEPPPKQDERLTFTFVTDGVASAVEQATAAAADKAVQVVGGASVVQQLLRAGWIQNQPQVPHREAGLSRSVECSRECMMTWVQVSRLEESHMVKPRTASEQITEEVTSWPGVTAGPGRRGEFAFRVGSREIGHLHGDHAAHFFFPKHVWADLFSERRVVHHPVFPDKRGPAARRIEDEADVSDVIQLLRLNYDRVIARHGMPT